jgi:hypothetical protein
MSGLIRALLVDGPLGDAVLTLVQRMIALLHGWSAPGTCPSGTLLRVWSRVVFPFVKSPAEVMKAAVDYEPTRGDLLPFAIAILVNYEMAEFAVLVRPMFEAGQVRAFSHATAIPFWTVSDFTNDHSRS